MHQDSLAGLWRGLTILLLEAAIQVLQLSHHLAVQHLLLVAMLLGLFIVALLPSTLIPLLQIPLALEQCPMLPLPLEQCPMRRSFEVIHLLPLHLCGCNHYLPELLHLLELQGMYLWGISVMEGIEGLGVLTMLCIL